MTFDPQGTTALVTGASSGIGAAFAHATPRMAVYGATKSFALSFSEALWYEARGAVGSALKVLALCPGPTDTEFVGIADNRDLMFGRWRSPERVVGTALRALDRRHPPASVVSGAANAVTAKSVGLVPRRMLLNIAGRIGAPKGR